jgi:hypothetical protein
MKKLTLLVTVVFVCLFMYVGNVRAATTMLTKEELLGSGYTLLKSDNGLYSSKNINFATFQWAKGDAAYIHQLVTSKYDNSNFYLSLEVDKDGAEPFYSNDTFTSNDNNIQFQTYQHENGGYYWLIEDITITNTNNDSDQDYNDLWARIDTKNVTPTPVPAAVWLFGSGLVGLVGIRRTRQSN